MSKSSRHPLSLSFSWVLAGLLIVQAGAGCGHSKSVGDTTAAKPEEGNAAEAKHAKARASSEDDRADGAGVRKRAEAATRPEVDARKGAPPIATSPSGLLKPDAAKQIQEKLAARGHLEKGHSSGKLDESTREALRAFQRAGGLPATGIPDDATVAKLGLNPTDVFRSADSNDAAAASKH